MEKKDWSVGWRMIVKIKMMERKRIIEKDGIGWKRKKVERIGSWMKEKNGKWKLVRKGWRIFKKNEIKKKKKRIIREIGKKESGGNEEKKEEINEGWKNEIF